MKSFTGISQSKKLAEILPLESADMCYGINNDTLKYNDLPWLIPYHKYTVKEYYIPCWSLAALIDVLDRGALFKTPQGWACQAYIGPKAITSNYHSNPIDAYYEIIIELHKQKLL